MKDQLSKIHLQLDLRYPPNPPFFLTFTFPDPHQTPKQSLQQKVRLFPKYRPPSTKNCRSPNLRT